LKYNYIIISAGIAWALAQIIKTGLNTFSNKKFSAERLFGSGGMPSSHSSFVAAALTATGRVKGIGDPLFAVMFVVACVVMYDAMNVRYAAGLHAKELNRLNILMKDENSRENPKNRKKLKEYLGHTPIEVLCGVALGIAVAFVTPISVK
jgi:acid phosphatase family membrane protein YuiD